MYVPNRARVVYFTFANSSLYYYGLLVAAVLYTVVYVNCENYIHTLKNYVENESKNGMTELPGDNFILLLTFLQ